MLLQQAVLVLATSLLWVVPSWAALRSFNLSISSNWAAPDGFNRSIYLINGQAPGPLIEVDEGDDIEVFVQNDLEVENTIHWHGILQIGSPEMDGVPGVSQYPIPAGGNMTYKFSVTGQYGFHWYHSHFKGEYDDAIRGPFLIHPSPSHQRPFESLANSTAELQALLDAELQAVPLVMHDWNHQTSEVIYSQYMENGIYPFCSDSILTNGLGRVQCLPDYILQAGTGLGLDGNSSDMMSSSMGMSGMGMVKRGDSGAGTPAMSMSMDMSMSMSMDSAMGMTSTSVSSPTTGTTSTSSSMSSSDISSMSEMSDMSSMFGMSASTTPLTSRGCMPPMMRSPTFNTSSLPPDTCQNTTTPLLNITANTTSGWLALNLVNAGAISNLAVSLDSHSMYIYAAEGLYVSLQEVQVLYISVGQSYSAMIQLDQMPGDYEFRIASYPTDIMQQVLETQAIVSYSSSPGMNTSSMLMDDPSSIWMLLNGSAVAGATSSNSSALSPFESNPPPSGAADVTENFLVSQTGILNWTLNAAVENASYSEAEIPILHGNTSDAWMADTTYHLPFNKTVDLILNMANDSMDNMGHPIHLHGHKFWVLGSGNGTFPYSDVAAAPALMLNMINPPYRDTADLPQGGWLVIRFRSDNPGAWMLHCHIQWHLLIGMAVVFVEGEEVIPDLLKRANVSLVPPASATRTTTMSTAGSPSPSATKASSANRVIGGGSTVSIVFIALLISPWFLL